MKNVRTYLREKELGMFVIIGPFEDPTLMGKVPQLHQIWQELIPLQGIGTQLFLMSFPTGKVH